MAQENENQLPIYLFHQGNNFYSYKYLGSHIICLGGKSGVIFRVWAPNAKKIHLVGDFNN